MTRLRWPRALPRPIFQTQTLAPDFGVEAFDMDSGWQEERRRFSHLPGVHSFALRLSALEQDILLAFAQKVAGGVFEADLWMPGMSRDGCETFACRFVSLAQSGEITTGRWRWNVSLRIEALNPANFDDLAFLAEYGEEALSAANLFDTLVNETMPDHMGAA
ncbi:hypothetical protein [Hyphomonas sp.]|uniref:hypothetical protein n=1 Tax=Hyphomonas sp. TaxID=87 RepID=UPI003919052A